MATQPDTAHPTRPERWLALLKRELVVLLLLGGTLGMLAWQRWGMERTIIVDPDSGLVRATTIDDNGEGGSSVCTVQTDSNGWWLRYDVRKGPNWCFCGLNLAFVEGDSAVGMDLTGFDTLIVNLLGMQGPNERLQVQIKASDPRLLEEAGLESLKYHDMILVPGKSGPSRTSMPLDNFVIPPWWAGRYNVPARNLNPTRKDVREIEFATSADKIILGTGTFGVRNLELHGKWISQASLLKILLAIWFAYIAGGLVRRLYRSFQEIRDLQGQTNRLKDLSERDPLTLLHNRRGLENRLAGMTQKCVGPDNPTLGLLMVDLDHFKSANDTLGHDAGDQILRILSGILLEEMRPNNIAARWGGEEFILLLPGIPPERLAPAAERLRARIESDLRYNGLSFTASIGGTLGAVDDFDELVKRADEALYRAKTNGRNRVELAE